MSGLSYLGILAVIFLITLLLVCVGGDGEEEDFDKFCENHPFIGFFVTLNCVALTFGFIIGAFWFTSYILSPSPKPEYTTEYATKEQPKNKAEVVKVVNDAIKEKNLKTDESKWLLENKKTKLTVKAEIEEGSNIKEAKLEFVVDSITDKDIDFAHNAIAGIVTKIQE